MCDHLCSPRIGFSLANSCCLRPIRRLLRSFYLFLCKRIFNSSITCALFWQFLLLWTLWSLSCNFSILLIRLLILNLHQRLGRDWCYYHLFQICIISLFLISNLTICWHCFRFNGYRGGRCDGNWLFSAGTLHLYRLFLLLYGALSSLCNNSWIC